MPLSPELRDEILGCLRRSGYLLESRVVSSLADAGFFVEPNAAVMDSRSGKSREIDVLAEYYEYDPDHPKISVKSHFAIEAINNYLPLVLMTPYPGPPNIEVNDLRYVTVPDPNAFEEEIDLYEEKAVFEIVRYSQYCALTRKKSGDELMASHPDDLYASLLKLAEFTEQQVREVENREWHADDDYWRLWFWQGVLVVGGDLVTAVPDAAGELSIQEIDRASLIFSFHVAEQPTNLVIEIVRERALLPYLQRAVAADHRLTVRLHGIRSALASAALSKETL
ncbi:MAG: hypothetical protein QOI58_1554 [Thermoanaerobaculia bacterium]|jgi:hypothetical protein|nr:hypothetical protein [Thermoanaerobaculia bacterium]